MRATKHASSDRNLSVSSRILRILRSARRRKISAFTLVELVVVVTILAILAAIAFFQFQDAATWTRDASRMADLKTSFDGIRIYEVRNGRYPEPETPSVEIQLDSAGNAFTIYQGVFGDALRRETDFVGKGRDPSTGKDYTYSMSPGNATTRPKAQLLAVLEAGRPASASAYAPAPAARAASNETYVYGDSLGVVTDSDGTPIQETATGTLDLLASTGVVVHFGGSAFGNGTVEGDGATVKNFLLSAASGQIPCSPASYDGYSFPSVLHSQSGSASKPYPVAHGTGTTVMEVRCLDGAFDFPNAAVTGPFIACESGYVRSGNVCVPDVCSGTPVANAVSTATSQSAFQPWHYAASAGVCTFACQTNYTWNGSACQADTRPATCSSIPANAVWNTASGITQTWAGSEWLPTSASAYSETASSAECRFKCAANYSWHAATALCTDQTAPSVASATASSPACGTIRVTVAASDAVALHSQAYSFDGGSTWQSENTKDYATTSGTLDAGQIKVRDAAGNVAAYGSALSGTAPGCDCALPWGGTLAAGGSVTAYQASSVACGSPCVSETRTCANGILSGSYTNQNCTAAACASCTLPWGGTLVHGQSVPAYSASSATSPTTCSSISETRTCNNGTLGGSYTIQNCTQNYRSCSLPWGGTIAHNGTTTAYAASSVACGSTCTSQVRTCNDGTLGGSYSNQSCSASCASCTLPWGGTLAHGGTTPAWNASSATSPTMCASQTRTCNNGTLDGSYANQNCIQNYRSCSIPWGGTVNHNNKITAWASSSVACGSSCTSQDRWCNDGSLGGSYTNSSCSVAACYTYSWYTGSWGACSYNSSTERGSQTRSVYCQRSDGASALDSYCTGTKPSPTRAMCCGGTATL